MKTDIYGWVTELLDVYDGTFESGNKVCAKFVSKIEKKYPKSWHCDFNYGASLIATYYAVFNIPNNMVLEVYSTRELPDVTRAICKFGFG